MHNTNPHKRTTPIVAIAVASVVAACSARAAAPQTEALHHLNLAFREIYKAARQTLHNNGDPILLAYSSDRLVLIHRDKRDEINCVPELETTLKTFAHAPLALFAALLPGVDHTLSDATRASLRAFDVSLLAAPGDWLHLGLNAAQRERQQRIHATTHAMLTSTLANNGVSDTDLRAFAHTVRPWIYANIADAARADVDMLHTLTLKIRQDLGDDAWQRLRVAVVGSHMARQGEHTLQYFLHVLGETQEGKRVIYVEGSRDEAAVLDLLAVHHIDNTASAAFFDDPQRLHRDVMADATTDYLNTIDVIQ